jgi:hypothetical protein
MASPEKSLRGKTKSKSKSKKSSSKHKPRHTHIEHGEDGSHVIRHTFDQGGEGEEPTPDSVHGVSDANGLLAHMQDQFGGQLPGADAGGGGAPGPAAAGAGAAAQPLPQAAG